MILKDAAHIRQKKVMFIKKVCYIPRLYETLNIVSINDKRLEKIRIIKMSQQAYSS